MAYVVEEYIGAVTENVAFFYDKKDAELFIKAREDNQYLGIKEMKTEAGIGYVRFYDKQKK